MYSHIIRLFLFLALATSSMAAFAVTPMVAGGWSHTVALQSDGTVLAWGGNGQGQLGDGTTTNRSSPVVVPGLTGVVAVAAGAGYSVALRSDGTVLAWGGNGQGQLGDGTTIDRSSPVVVPGLTGVVAVAAGGWHTVALKSDGTVLAWGYNGNGQLGDGTTTQRLSPVVVPGLTGVAAVSAGSHHTVALKSDGTALAWGGNGQGQLGDGTKIDRSSPVVVPGLTGVAAVLAGSHHTVALKSDGTVLAWGNNGQGQLGDGTKIDRSNPVVVPGLTGMVAVEAGGWHTVALKSDGTVLAWGNNGQGQLGDGTTIDRSNPVVVPGLTGVASLTAGWIHTVAVKSDGTVLAWGYNGWGQLGLGYANLQSFIKSPAATLGVGGVGFLDLTPSVTSVPVLSFAAEAGYGTVGVSPSTGTATTSFAYKVVYNDSDNLAPALIQVCIDAVCNPMSVDPAAAAALRDGNYANGEQYVSTTTLATGAHTYYFTASDGTTGVNLPASGSLTGPTVSDLSITTTELSDATIGAAYSQTLAAAGGMTPYVWAGTSLPAGLGLGGSTGVISGTPTTLGIYGFSVSVTDANGMTINQPLSITVVEQLTATMNWTGGTTQNAPFSVEISTNRPAAVYYTLDGTAPSTASAVYSGPILIGTTLTLKFIGVDTATGYTTAVQEQAFVIDAVAPTVTASVAGGTYNSAQNVTLSANEPATIHYTLDGSTPTTTSAVYAAAIAVNSSMTLKYFAVDTAGNTSSVQTEAYVIDTVAPTVTASVAGGTYTSVQSVTLSANEAATIYYTVNGTTPTMASAVYAAAIAVSNSLTLKYFAVDTADNASAVQTQAYVINLADAIAPTGSVVINGGASSTLTATVTLTLAATDNSGTVAQMRFSNDGTTWSAWEAYATSKSWTLSTGFGNKTVYAQFTDPTGNISVSVNDGIYYVPEVDLAPVSLSTSATSVNIGTSLTVSDTVKNQGTEVMSASSFRVSYYLSTDATITTADRLIGSRTVLRLGAGASDSGVTPITIVPSTPTGTYYLGMLVDSNDTQPETNETNNTKVASGKVTVISDVDLVMSAVNTTTTSVPIGGSFTIDSTETNQGTTVMSASNNKVAFYLSTDNVITSSDILLTGSLTVSPLDAGESSSAAATLVTVAKTLEPGTYYYGAIADSFSAQAESNETNNARAGGTITVVRDVDLVMSAVNTTTTSVPIGGSFTIDSTETNQGTTVMSASNNKVAFYLSTDSVITSSDILLPGSLTVSPLDAGESSSAAATLVTVAKTLEPGTYYYGAIADINNTQPESNETNNARAGGTITVVRDVDLVMSAVNTTTTSVPIGGSFTIDSTETNQGTTVMSASNNKVAFYLSTDSVITSSDILLPGSLTVSPLDAGESSSAAATLVTVAKTLEPGTYYYGAIADINNTQPESNETNNARAGGTITVVRDVDLVMSAVNTTTTSVPIGGSFTIDSTETNQGTTVMSASNNKVTFYLSTDSVITSSDILLTGSLTVSPLAAGQSSAAATLVTVAKTLEPGTYYYGAIADINNTQPESNETNNARAGGTITVVRDVDLVMSAVNTTTTSVPIGGSFTIDSTETNQGTTVMSASSTAVKFYLSTDSVITSSDILLTGSLTVSPLAAGQSSAASTLVTVAKTLEPGTYYYGAIADINNTQPESNETNNARAGGTITVVRDVDLVMSAVNTTTTSVPIGGSFTIDSTETNQGTTVMSASNNKVAFYLSTDSVITSSDILLTGSLTVSPLAAGQSSAASTLVTVAKTLEPGTYYYGAIADINNTQPESNETNNARAGGTITVVRDVDLVPTSFSTTATSANIGSNITVGSTVANQGTTVTSASSFTVSYYLSTDATITTADRLIGSRNIAGLAAGASNTASQTVTIPTSMVLGTYYLGVLVDSANVQPENNETNNALVASGTLTVTNGVDLVVTALDEQWLSTSPAGSTQTLTDNITNRGTTATTSSVGFTVKYYLSTDNVITTADSYIGIRTIGSLAAGATNNGNITVTIPSTLANGDYYVGAIVDAQGNQAEDDETNNTLFLGSSVSICTPAGNVVCAQ